MEIPIMVNGKTKTTFDIDPEDDRHIIWQKVENVEEIKEATQGKVICNVIHVPNKMANIIVKG